MLLDLDPVMFTLGPLTVRWYGFFMAVSMAVGIYYLVKHGSARGMSEDALYNVSLLGILGGVIGARIVYVATNWSDYAGNLIEILRVDHGGLSFHGAVGGGMLAFWLYARRAGLSLPALFDLAVPGVCVGIMLVRIGNIFNGEVLGHVAEALPFDRHPAQVYGSLVGLVTLLIHNALARRNPPEGYLFWSFVFWYQLLRGFIEETFRDNPLYAWGYVNETWGVGFFTLTHLITPLILALAWWMRRQAWLRGGTQVPESD
ncbi:MAG TPA: prolipoprotein diacylglyceryl transferase [Bacillota bacterium]